MEALRRLPKKALMSIVAELRQLVKMCTWTPVGRQSLSGKQLEDYSVVVSIDWGI